jgi:hypothetical protein
MMAAAARSGAYLHKAPIDIELVFQVYIAVLIESEFGVGPFHYLVRSKTCFPRALMAVVQLYMPDFRFHCGNIHLLNGTAS